MIEPLQPSRFLKGLFRAICRRSPESRPREDDVDQPAEGEEVSSGKFLQDFVSRRQVQRSLGQSSFRYLRLDVCDH